ncbi:hypothetical protein CWN73_19810 [Klebsiella quasipneumoniae]|nr:hypothetical protein CWN73_19810 [Klebsiella quasipneumoniae]
MTTNQSAQTLPSTDAPPQKARTSFGILGAISLSHLLNDMIQSLILAIYPLLQAEFSLTFVQIGMITLTFQLTSSLFQPVIGYITDKRSMPWSLPVGMCFTLCGLILLALAGSFGMVLLAAALVGTGSSVFHPESSRVARMASGGRHGLAQSLFQVGGNFGSSLGPLLAAVIINQLAQHLMPVQRASPSLFFSDVTRVSDVVNFPTKDASKDSFPGDHGMMLLIFASFMWRYFGRRALAVALVIFVAFAFPRVMIGAHWFSDIAVGSLTAVLIGAPWVLMTPLSDKLIAFFDRYLPGGISAK